MQIHLVLWKLIKTNKIFIVFRVFSFKNTLFHKNMTEHETRKQILGVCRKYFLRFGYSKVTMDELAREMAMSKKTIYVFFRKGKKEILTEIFADIRAEILQGANKILELENTSFSEKLRQVLIFVGENLSAISPYVSADLERNVPEIWEQVKKMKHELAFQNMKRLMEDAQRTGEIRAEINVDLLILFYTCAVNYIRDNSYLNDFPKEIQEKIPATTDKVFEGIVEMLYNGILAK